MEVQSAELLNILLSQPHFGTTLAYLHRHVLTKQHEPSIFVHQIELFLGVVFCMLTQYVYPLVSVNITRLQISFTREMLISDHFLPKNRMHG